MMLKINILTALLTVLAATLLIKGENTKFNPENLRKLLDETNADETSFAARNIEEDGKDSNENLKDENDDGSYISSRMEENFDEEELEETEQQQEEKISKFESSQYSSDENSNQRSDIFEKEAATQRILENSGKSSLLQLDEMISKANPGLKASKRDLEETDMIDGDVKLDEDSAADLVEFYKRNPQYLKIENNETDTSVFKTYDRRKVRKEGRWSFPIKYRIQLASSRDKDLVRKAIRIWQEETCVTFRETEKLSSPGINFKENEKGCWSYVGRRRSGINDINLADGCKQLGIILHEIGHALGMWHEQSRPDRERYVSILTNNIISGKERSFMVRPSITYGVQYDYGSIMHYSNRAFGKNGLKTIIAKQRDYEKTMGQRIGLSFNDVMAINAHYCQNRCSRGLQSSRCKHGGYKNPKLCSFCKCPEGISGQYCFSIEYGTSLGCGETLRSANSRYEYLNSPGYFSPGYYTRTGSECVWKITAPYGKRVRLEFTGTFGINCHKRCLDYVEVRYDRFTNTGPRYCCNSRPRRIFTSKGPQMLVLFRTNADSGARARGFRAKYKYV